MPKPPTAHAIDEACRLGHFCWYGNRQKILGAVSSLREQGEAAPGCVWIHRASDLEWQQVKLSEVVIEERNGGTMPQKGKRENGRPGLPSGGPTRVSAPKKDAPKQPDLPGVEQEKLPAIERAAKKYNGLKEPFAEARDNLSSAKDSLIKMMHDKVKPNDAGELVYKRGDVKVTIKPSKEKLKVVIGDDDGDESDIEVDEE